MTHAAKLTAKDLIEAVMKERRTLERWDPTCAFGDYHEAHLAFALGQALTRAGAQAVLEARSRVRAPPYGRADDAKFRYDVYADFSGQGWWIEIKRGWDGRGSNWVTKPREQFESWLRDLEKLKRIREPRARHAFLLVHFRQGNLDYPDIAPRDVEACAKNICTKLDAGRDPVFRAPPCPGRMTMPKALSILELALRMLGDAERIHDANETASGLKYTYLAGTF